MRDDERFTAADELPVGLMEATEAMAAKMRDVEGYTVPWTAGRAIDGSEFYPDEELPKEVAAVNTRQSVKRHECAELICMNAGMTYDQFSVPPGLAHYHANGVEKLNVEAQGGTWEPYCLALRPTMKKIDAEVLTNLPPADRWDKRMYADDDRKLLDQIDAADKAVIVLNGGDAALSKGDDTVDNLQIFVPITKIDVAKRLVYGTMAEEIVDKSKEMFDYASSKPLFEKWSGEIAKNTDGKSVGNLRSMHQPIAAGKLTDIVFNDTALKIETCAKVVDEAEWKKVEEGVYTGFSIGGKYVKRWADPANEGVTRYTADPHEVSLVDNPCIPTATFTAIKADGTSEMRKFKGAAPAVEPPAGVVAERAMELAAAAGSTAWHDFIDPARNELAKEAGAPAHGEVPGDDGSEQQVFIHPKLPGEFFATKAAMRQALAKKSGAAAAATAVAPVVDALKGLADELNKRDGRMTVGQLAIATSAIIRDRADMPLFDEAVKFFAAQPEHELSKRIGVLPPLSFGADAKPIVPADLEAAIRAFAADVVKLELADVGKREFTDEQRKKMAGEGKAMKDGSFPIENKDDLKNAIKAYGRAKNKAAAKRHIIKRAKALGATDLLPDDWKSKSKDDSKKIAGDPELAKTASLWSLSNLLQLLASIEAAEEDFEFPGYGLGMYGGAALPKELCDRFGALVVELGDIVAEALDVILAAMKEEEANEAMTRCADFRNLLKAGARHSKGDVELLNKAHDALVELGAECKGGTEKIVGGADVEKLTAQIETIVAERDALVKQLGDLVPVLKDVHERVVRIEAQPAVVPPRGLLSIDKNGVAVPLGGGGGDGPLSALDIDKIVENLDQSKLNELARALIKRSQENPISVYGPGR